jgi:hypothetical protein
MYIESVPNRDSPPAILLRESYREDGKVRKRTLANLSCLSAEVLEGLKVLMRGGVAVPSAESVFVVERSLPHGHVAAVLGAASGSGSSSWFGTRPTLITSQLPVKAWHTYLNDPTLADAILDRVVHSSHKIELKATKSLRDTEAQQTS